jgi:hypothetical protein
MVTKWQISGKMANKTRINNILTLFQAKNQSKTAFLLYFLRKKGLKKPFFLTTTFLFQGFQGCFFLTLWGFVQESTRLF